MRGHSRGMRSAQVGFYAAAFAVMSGCGGDVENIRLGGDDDAEEDSGTAAPADAGTTPHPTPKPPLTYYGVDEHPGCLEPPCCNGGSPDTNIEVTSKCKYTVRALWLCGCYAGLEIELDQALRACVDYYVAQGQLCPGMNCESITTCESLRYVTEELRGAGMPAYAPSCDFSPVREIMSEVYADCR